MVTRLVKARRSGRPRKMSARSEARLKRLVKKKRGKILRDIATEFNIGHTFWMVCFMSGSPHVSLVILANNNL
jgi:hypothetical protein